MSIYLVPSLGGCSEINSIIKSKLETLLTLTEVKNMPKLGLEVVDSEFCLFFLLFSNSFHN